MKDLHLKRKIFGILDEVTSYLELIVAAIVLVGMLLSIWPTLMEAGGMWRLDVNSDDFVLFMTHAFNLVIGIEFIKMLVRHSPDSAVEVLMFALARQLVVGHHTAIENLLGVVAISIIFFTRKYLMNDSSLFGTLRENKELKKEKQERQKAKEHEKETEKEHEPEHVQENV